MTELRIILLVFLLVCAIAVSFSKNLLISVVIYMAFSLIMAIIWLILESPDLAITESGCRRRSDKYPFLCNTKKIRSIKTTARRILMSKKNPNYQNSFADRVYKMGKGRLRSYRRSDGDECTG